MNPIFSLCMFLAAFSDLALAYKQYTYHDFGTMLALIGASMLFAALGCGFHRVK